MCNQCARSRANIRISDFIQIQANHLYWVSFRPWWSRSHVIVAKTALCQKPSLGDPPCLHLCSKPMACFIRSSSLLLYFVWFPVFSPTEWHSYISSQWPLEAAITWTMKTLIVTQVWERALLLITALLIVSQSKFSNDCNYMLIGVGLCTLGIKEFLG